MNRQCVQLRLRVGSLMLSTSIIIYLTAVDSRLILSTVDEIEIMLSASVSLSVTTLLREIVLPLSVAA